MKQPFLFLALLGVALASQLRSASQLLQYLDDLRYNRAREYLEDHPEIAARDFVTLPSVEQHFPFFRMLDRFKFTRSQWATFLQRFREKELIQNLMASDCGDLKERWMEISGRPYSQMSIVEVYYVISEISHGFNAYQIATSELEAPRRSNDRLSSSRTASDNDRLSSSLASFGREPRTVPDGQARSRDSRSSSLRQSPASTGSSSARTSSVSASLVSSVPRPSSSQTISRPPQSAVQRSRGGQTSTLGRQTSDTRQNQTSAPTRQNNTRQNQTLTPTRQTTRRPTPIQRTITTATPSRRPRLVDTDSSSSTESTEEEDGTLVDMMADMSLVDVPSFNRKLAAFRASPALQRAYNAYDRRQITVSRGRLLVDSYNAIMALPINCAKGGWSVRFDGESGIDAGGLRREFITTVAKSLFNPDLALFNFSATGNYAVQIHPSSHANREEWGFYKFAGRFIGMAIFDRQPIGTAFSSAFLKSILQVPYDLKDLKDIDADVHRNLKYALENDVEDLCLTFSVNHEEFGVNQTVELKNDGENIDVTEANKREYMDLMVNFHVKDRVDQQAQLIKQGLYEILPYDSLRAFTWPELKFLISGSTKIDVQDWKANTRYQYCDANHSVVVMFWDYVERKLTDKDRANLLQFVTGSPYPPITGFRDLQGSGGNSCLFTVSVNSFSDQKFVTSHTCFNDLVIPVHANRAEFEEYMMIAIRNYLGFGTA